jgi:glycosyltransferase involved in cell wall biosynthesis
MIWTYYVLRGKNHNKNLKIIGLIRERNESLILKDSLDHLSNFVDGIIVFDDASSDESVKIAQDHENVLAVICRKKWQSGVNRSWVETADRRLLLQYAKRYNPEWFFYIDADERFDGKIREFLLSPQSKNVNGVRISLFDAYMTENDKKAYKSGELFDFRKYFGVERRNILMIWRNLPNIDYIMPDAREPQGIDEDKETTRFFSQHYGKALSEEHWEETCDYYIKHFPQYSEKWRSRKGRAIHSKSDFGRKLLTWETLKKDGGIKID